MAALAAPAAAASPVELAAPLAELQRIELTGGAVEIQNLALRAGPARVVLESGLVFDTSPVAGRVVEMVFVGAGRIELTPPDEIEAQQLELHTGQRVLAERFTAATLVIAHDESSARLFARARAAPSAPVLEHARREHAGWRSSPLRRLLGADLALLADALGERGAESYFAAWLDGASLGRFLYLFEPRNDEQVTLGAFVPLELTRGEERQARREMKRQQRRGRLVGIELDDLGTWNTWLSMARRQAEPGAQGDLVAPGAPGFEPEHYELDVRLTGRALDLAGTARLHLVADASAGHLLRCRLLSDLIVDSAALASGETGQSGQVLPFHQAGSEVLVVLPSAPGNGEKITLELRYHGPALEPVAGSAAYGLLLRDTEAWYPHAGQVDLATYDVTLHWPERFDLLAMGEPAPEHRGRGERHRRFSVAHRTKFYTFEVGHFERVSRQIGHIDTQLAVDELSAVLISRPQVVLDWIADALFFLEQSFGPLPIDHLTVVTTMRPFSQAPLGFATLSTAMLNDDEMSALAGAEDPRALVAHELSHQWWGHMVSWRSYRDRWLSEALATYSSLVYARHRLADRSADWQHPTENWQDELLSLAANGQTIESLGPVVLAERLESSLAENAYTAIVYTKGALVIDQLAHLAGEQRFLAVLSALAQRAAFRTATTEDLLAMVARATGLDLDGFAQRFVYGTGVPHVEYRYRSEPSGSGARITTEFERSGQLLARLRPVERGGQLDVVREPPAQPSYDALALSTPVEIELPGEPGEGQRPRGSANEAKKVRGRMLLGRDGTPAELEVAAAPLRVTLDPDGATFGLFWDRTAPPRDQLVPLANRLVLLGRENEANALLELARRPAQAGETPGEAAAAPAASHLASARLALNHDRIAEGQTHLAAARAALKQVPGDDRGRLPALLDVIDGRRLLRQGDPARARRVLEPLVFPSGELAHDPEALLLLAAVAKAAGDQPLLERTLERLRPLRARVSGLELLEH